MLWRAFSILRDGVKLLCSIDIVVLRQETYDSLIAGIGFPDSCKGMSKLSEDKGALESSSYLVQGLLFLMSPTGWYIFGEVDEGACLRTVVRNKSTVVVSKA